MGTRTIIGHVTCPRCNAEAQVRAEERDNGVLTLYIECSKCRLRKFTGLSSWAAYNAEVTMEELKSWLERATDETLKDSIRGKIHNLEQVIKEKEIGL